MTTFDAAVDAAARDFAEGLARQDARSPRDAAIAALGANATDQQIGDWIARFRQERSAANTA